MADEKKTYLVNIESNLNKYAQDAAKAKEEVDKLTASNNELKKSGTATTAEIEANNAALRNAQKEYNQAKKMVDLQTAANKGEIGSRKQLGEILQLQMQALGKLGGAYITNAKGVRELNPLYIEQRKRIAETKQAILDYDKALNDGRSNVGRYGEAMKGAFASVSTSLKDAALNLVSFAAVAALATKAIEGIKAAFFSTDEGIGVLKRWSEAAKVFFRGVIYSHGPDDMKMADAAIKELEKLRILERSEQVRAAAMQNEVKMLRLKAAGVKDLQEQIKIYEEADKIENERIAIKTEHLQSEIRWKQVLYMQTRDATIADEIAAAQAELVGIEGEKNMRIAVKIAGNKEKILKEEQIRNEKAAETVKKQNEDNIKWTEDLYKSIEEVHDTALKAKKAADEKAAEDAVKLAEDTAKRLSESNEAGFEYQRLKAGESVDMLQQILNAEYRAMLASVEYKDMTTNEKLLIDQQYTENTRQLSILRIQQQAQELDLVSNIFGSLSGLMSKQTGAAKALSIAQALISTYTAGVKAMAELPLGSGPILRFLTLASVIAAGMLQVKNIMAVKVPGGGGGGQSAPTAISSSQPAQRAFAQSAGSSVLTQAQLSQPQLNAIPNQNMLTAADIAVALSKLPSPIVTVEDINAKVKSVNKVTVRANI
jgi:hypothetical protein